MWSRHMVVMWVGNATMKTDLDLDQSGERRFYGWRVYHLGSQHCHCPA
jgi:hypothetical protein